jgi:hypothetical protein
MPFKTGRTRAASLGELIHMDLAGPMETVSLGGKKYFLLIKDDYSRAVWVEALALKSQVAAKVKEFITAFENGYNACVRGVMADNGTEFINADLQNFFKARGITFYSSVPYTHQQNGVAEREIRTITEGARAMLYAAKLPKRLWSVAIKTMAYLRNRSPTRANDGRTPIEILTGGKPDLAHLRIFGSPVSVAIPAEKRQKWDSRSRMGYMVGYEPYETGYLIWYPRTNRIEKARDVIFHEDAIAPAVPKLYDDEELVEDISKPPTDEKEPLTPSKPPEPQLKPTEQPRLTIRIPPRSARDVKPQEELPPRREDTKLVSYVPDLPRGVTRSGKQREEGQAHLAIEEETLNYIALSAVAENPTTIQEALALPGEEGEAWEEARQAEWQNMLDHDVFGAPAEPPQGTKVLRMGTAIKTSRRDGEIKKRKVRIVAKGYSQIPGLHFNETYAPVMRWESFRLILALGAISGKKIRQFDVKSAYLHGTMKEEVWVEQPEGFEIPGKEHLALPLQRALYGTKQGGNEWRKTLYEFMTLNLRWICQDYDTAVFAKMWNDDTWAVVGFWVDDATSTGTERRLLELEDAFKERFEISSEGEAEWVLGANIQQNAKSKSVVISQKEYIENIAAKFNVQNSKPLKSPLPQGIDFSAIGRHETDVESQDTADLPYREIIGSLMFAATVSRPDIAYSVNKLAQYSNNPTPAQWNLAKRVLQYLYSTRDWGLHLGGNQLCLHAYSDADFAADTDDRRSTGGYAVFLGSGAISWSSKKQTVVALSSTESEYIALSEVSREVLWTRHFLEEIDIVYDEPTTIFEDNQGTIAFATNQKSLRRMKHIDVKFHFIRNLIEEGVIRLQYRRTTEMVADIFTKALPPSTHDQHARSLGVYPSSLEEEC